MIGGETQCIAVLTSPAGLLVGERYLSRFPSSHDSPLTLGSTGGDKHTNGNHEYSSDRHKRHTRRAQNCHKLKLVSTGETCAIGGSVYNMANSVTCECWIRGQQHKMRGSKYLSVHWVTAELHGVERAGSREVQAT